MQSIMYAHTHVLEHNPPKAVIGQAEVLQVIKQVPCQLLLLLPSSTNCSTDHSCYNGKYSPYLITSTLCLHLPFLRLNHLTAKAQDLKIT